MMSTPPLRQNTAITAQPIRDDTPRNLIVTASVTIFAIRDWTLWVLLREGPWGPPMRVVRGTESVTEAVDRAIDALLMWPTHASLMQLKAGWQEQQVFVRGNTEPGAAVTLIHSVLLRANRDELRAKSGSSLQVGWAAVADIESGQHVLDPEVRPVLQNAIHTLRSRVQRDPEIVLHYLADMGNYQGIDGRPDEATMTMGKETRPMSIFKEPSSGDGKLTLAEAALLYRAFFTPEEQIDLSNLRRRFLATNYLKPLDEERPVRGRELDWRRVSRVYHYQAPTW